TVSGSLIRDITKLPELRKVFLGLIFDKGHKNSSSHYSSSSSSSFDNDNFSGGGGSSGGGGASGRW
ncbi:TPA: hypothetical protein ACRUZI_002093, partial [Escherichia coli]